MKTLSLVLTLIGVAGFLGAVSAQELVATLDLSGTSYVSFEDEEALFLPAGSRITFRFGAPLEDGTVPFSIAPDAVTIPAIPIADGSTIEYSLAKPASGLLRKSESGLVLEYAATVRATRRLDEKSASSYYPLLFTTEPVQATNRAGTKTLEVAGNRLDAGSRGLVLVAATTNRSEAYPAPGLAVYAWLAGTFDRLPTVP